MYENAYEDEFFFYDPYPAELLRSAAKKPSGRDSVGRISAEIEEIQTKIDGMLNRYKTYKSLGAHERCAAIQARVSGFIGAKNELVFRKMELERTG